MSSNRFNVLYKLFLTVQCSVFYHSNRAKNHSYFIDISLDFVNKEAGAPYSFLYLQLSIFFCET